MYLELFIKLFFIWEISIIKKFEQAMNERLKEQMREEDPMAEYFRVKNHKVQMRSGIGEMQINLHIILSII